MFPNVNSEDAYRPGNLYFKGGSHTHLGNPQRQYESNLHTMKETYVNREEHQKIAEQNSLQNSNVLERGVSNELVVQIRAPTMEQRCTYIDDEGKP